MTTFVVYVVVLALVAGVFFLVASLVFGRGEELAPLPPGVTPTVLPAADISASDVRALRFPQALRGYRAAEVDWALARLAEEIDRLRAGTAPPEPTEPPVNTAERSSAERTNTEGSMSTEDRWN